MESRDILLTADERYDIWNVKRLERPYLLLEESGVDRNDNHNEHNGEEDKKDDFDHHPDDDDDDYDDTHCHNNLPLIDGCDIQKWHTQQFIKLSEFHQATLNIGSGCTLLRRESQLAVVIVGSQRRRQQQQRHQQQESLSTRQQLQSCPLPRADDQWIKLQQQFMIPPTESPSNIIRIPSQEAINLGPSPWFERENMPVLLEDGFTSNWRAMESCKWDNLVTSYGEDQWRFSDTHGGTMSLHTYDKYTRNLEGFVDDAPLAVYDSQFGFCQNRKSILEDYQVPKCFNGPDLFGICFDDDNHGDDDDDEVCRRPPYRWILMGPERSGTGLHVDPMGTHAWVTLIEGCKRWVLFPYGTNPHDIGLKPNTETGIQIPSVIWFRDYYQNSITKVPDAIEVIQKPGETVYVPSGWPHLVLNLQRSVAITHNYATAYPSFSRIASSVKHEEPDFYRIWKTRLHNHRPDLVDIKMTIDNNKDIRD